MTDEVRKPKEIGEDNKNRILDAYTNYVEEHGKAPTIVFLSETVGLTRPIIYKHLKSLQIQELAVKFKPRAMTILEGVAKKAEEGDVNAAKLILNLAFGWNEKKVMETMNTNRSLKVIFTNPSSEDLKKITETKIDEAEFTVEDE